MELFCQPLFLFTFLSLLVMHNPKPYSCIYNCCNCGEVNPLNVYVTKGSTLVLNCTIEEDSSPYFLMFTFSNDNVDQSEFMELHGKNTILLRKVITDFEDQGVYYCYKNDKKVGSTYVEVEYPLQPVNDSDFWCVLYDWDHSLSCSWEMGAYKNKGNINVTVIAETRESPLEEDLEDQVHVYLFSYQRLYPAKINQTFCQWKETFDDPYWYRFYLTVHNIKTNQSVQSVFTKSAKSIVKPAPISDVFAENISSTCLTVKWTTRKFRFQVLVFIVSDEWNISIPQRKEVSPRDHVEQYLQLCDLIPFTDYTFNITRRKLTMTRQGYQEDGYWSDPAYFTFKTMPDVPASPPNITEGSFYHIYGNETILYWKPIKPIDRNGIVIGYFISYTSSDGKDNYSLSSQYENVTLSLHPEKCYNVSITAVTQEGYRSPSASVLIPPKTAIPTPSTVVIEVDRNRSSANIRWKGNKTCQHYVVFWMSGNNLDWKISFQNSTILAAPLHNLEKVGVSCSANLNHSSLENPHIAGGGLHWFRCKYFDEKEPALPVAVTVKPNQEALDLSWFIQCDDLSSYPQWINVTWCDLDLMNRCSQVWSHVLLEPGDRNCRLEGLDSTKTYRVRFSSLSKDGRTKEGSKIYDVKPYPIRDTSVSDIVNNPEIIWPIVGVLCVLMLVLAIWFARRKYRSKPEPAIEVPVVASKTSEKGSGYTNYTVQYTDKRDGNKYMILSEPILMDGFEAEKEKIFSNYYDDHIAKDEENTTDILEVPDILEDMEKSELYKKQKSTSQSSDYSKFITASGHTNNSDVFIQSRSQSDSHFSQSKPQSELSSIDFSQSKPQDEFSNHSGSSNYNKSKLNANGTGSDITEEEGLDKSSAFSSNEDGYREIRQDSTATDMSAYFETSYNTNSKVDSYSKVNVNEDVNAETDDELLVNLQSRSSNTEQNTDSAGSNGSSNLSSPCTTANVVPVEEQQAPVRGDVLLSSCVGDISLQNLQDSPPQMNETIIKSPPEDSDEEDSSNSGAPLPNSGGSLSNSGVPLPNSGGSLSNSGGPLPNSGGSLSNSGGSQSNSGGYLSSSTSGEDGYKTVDLNSGCASTVQSSDYTPIYGS
ncbi:uncharacterized protein LOC134254188 isoform X2 [Saccostrea cucullata]|uniref:uncharacterized protein LOC134254188 isoform X2 n=1 Tax=Saccostrea cuccullata TaxID=36930 RepID=UPI002ED1D734